MAHRGTVGQVQTKKNKWQWDTIKLYIIYIIIDGSWPILNFAEVPSFVLDNRLFYLSAHEIIGSTIDLSMMSSKNVANMIEDMFIDRIKNKDDI